MTPTIEVTTNYDQFHLINANRDQIRGHIERLKKAFEEKGNLTQVQPIIVNENFEIVDGQHRYTAAKELGMPIYYIMTNGLRIDDARQMNMLHNAWLTDDFARSYATTGNVNYIKYLELKEDYGVGHTTLLNYINNHYIRNPFKNFREGDLVIDNERDVRARLDRLAEFREISPIKVTKDLALALLNAMNAEGYDHSKMLRKVALEGETSLKPYLGIIDNTRQLEELYNRGTPVNKRLRFF